MRGTSARTKMVPLRRPADLRFHGLAVAPKGFTSGPNLLPDSALWRLIWNVIMQAFGGGLTVPVPVDVAVDGVSNAGVSDGETVLDITVASAIVQDATIAVYFTGGTTQNIIHALQRMIHPGTGDPVPAVLSISYGWGPGDENAQSFSDQEFTAIDQLFQDAASAGVTVLVPSGTQVLFWGHESRLRPAIRQPNPG